MVKLVLGFFCSLVLLCGCGNCATGLSEQPGAVIGAKGPGHEAEAVPVKAGKEPEASVIGESK